MPVDVFPPAFLMMYIDYSVPPAYENMRLDILISRIFDRCSRRQACEWILHGDLFVAGMHKKPSYRVKTGDHITGRRDNEKAILSIIPEPVTLDILYEDPHLMVINKPAGLVVHPGAGNETGTVVHALLNHDPSIAASADDPVRTGIVHRLDKDTSGVMVVGKTRQSLLFLLKEFKQRRVDKRYLAVVDKNPGPESGKIELPIGRHPVKRKMMSVSTTSVKPAITLWHVKERFDTAALIEAVLKTGRTHQIRVHLYAAGYPVMGDRVYQTRRNRRAGNSKVGRQLLHAWKISFRHPYSGIRLRFEAPLPDDFNRVLQQFRQQKAQDGLHRP